MGVRVPPSAPRILKISVKTHIFEVWEQPRYKHLSLGAFLPQFSLFETNRVIVETHAGVGVPWLAILIKVGALTGLTSVILVFLYGQSRIFFTMSNDGLLPDGFPDRAPRGFGRHTVVS